MITRRQVKYTKYLSHIEDYIFCIDHTGAYVFTVEVYQGDRQIGLYTVKGIATENRWYDEMAKLIYKTYYENKGE